MAMKPSLEPTESLDHAASRLAGLASVFFALLDAAGLIALMVATPALPAKTTALLVVLAAAAVLAATAGVQLVRGRPWAQRVLLVYWLIAAAAGAGVALTAVLWGAAGGWSQAVPLAAVAGPALVAAAMVALLVRASARGGRLRYASMVTVSVVVAVVLTVVINMIAQKDPIRKDVESLGLWALSDRSKAMLNDLDKPVRLTSVYTPGYKELSREDKALLESRRSRVWELLREMGEHNKKIEIQNLTSDAEKARLVARLRDQFGGKADDHVKSLERFQTVSRDVIEQLREERNDWSAAPKDGYLAEWGLPVDLTVMLKRDAEEMTLAAENVARETAGLPDYTKLTAQVAEVLTATKQDLEHACDLLARIGKLPQAVAAGETKAMQQLDDAVNAAKALTETIGAPEDPEPKDPKAMLAKIVEAASKAVEQLSTAAGTLENLAGKEDAELLLVHRGWQAEFGAGSLRLRATLPQILRIYAQKIDTDLRQEAQALSKAATEDYQRQYILNLRKSVTAFVESLQHVRQTTQAAIQAVSNVDEHAKGKCQLAAEAKLFQQVLKPVSALLEEIEKLPELKAGSGPGDIAQDNIVIVEVGEKVEVVGFDEVWALRAALGAPGGGAEPEKRVFNGDAAIGSKILKMTHEPFATVVLTYLAPPPRVSPEFLVTPTSLQGLQQCLEDANFKVKAWELTGKMPGDEDDEKDPAGEEGKGPAGPELQQVLLVLPPPPSLPPSPYSPPSTGFGETHMQKIRDQIDRGTPAAFLVSFAWQELNFDTGYEELNAYLKEQWGIDVNYRYRVIPTKRHETAPNKFSLDPARWNALPLSAFTNHPIGRPLQGQRVLWNDLCPVTAASVPPGVEVQTVLEVPYYWSDTWASKELEAILQKLQPGEEGLISPLPGDVLPPFSVGVAATRAGSDAVKPARIAVLATAASLNYRYLEGPLLVLSEKRGWQFLEPAKSNADVVINSVYWLIGKQQYIAAGPVEVTPVARMDKATQIVIQAIFVGGLPALVLVAGAVVLLVRKR